MKENIVNIKQYTTINLKIDVLKLITIYLVTLQIFTGIIISFCQPTIVKIITIIYIIISTIIIPVLYCGCAGFFDINENKDNKIVNINKK